MFTNNFYKYVSAWAVSSSVPTMTDVNGASKTLNAKFSPSLLPFQYVYKSSTSYSSGGVVFGNGTAEPQKTDYRLSGDLISTISITKKLVQAADSTGTSAEFTYTITNTGSSDITISEVGYIQNINYARSRTLTGDYAGSFDSNESSVSGGVVLMERTLLDTPVTIPAGGFGQVKYKLRCDFATE